MFKCLKTVGVFPFQGTSCNFPSRSWIEEETHYFSFWVYCTDFSLLSAILFCFGDRVFSVVYWCFYLLELVSVLAPPLEGAFSTYWAHCPRLPSGSSSMFSSTGDARTKYCRPRLSIVGCSSLEPGLGTDHTQTPISYTKRSFIKKGKRQDGWIWIKQKGQQTAFTGCEF